MPSLPNLSTEDWQYILYAVQTRINKAAPRKGEPPASADFSAQADRIFFALYPLAYPAKEGPAPK